MENEEIGRRIREILERDIVPGAAGAALSDTAPLLTSGVIDSLATMDLVGELEDEFGITIAAHEIHTDNFNRLTDIAALVESKLS